MNDTDVSGTKQKKEWLSPRPAKCDLCGGDLIDEDHFVDGKTTFGPWAIMCIPCHFFNGVGLGSRKGQLYDVKTLEKVGG